MIKAVLFDLDGTLINSIEDLACSTNYALSLLGFPTHETEKYRYFVGDGMIMLIKRALPEEIRDDETIKKCHEIFMNYYREHYCDKTVAYDGINELVQNLKSKGLKLAVISNKADEMTHILVNKLFPNMFDAITGKRPEYPTKPDASLTLKIIEELGVKPCECAFIGDSGMDMKTAVNSGVLPIGVPWGFRETKELFENGAEHIINQPLELLRVLESENAKV